MKRPARVLVHDAPGEKLAVMLDRDERPFSLFLERWGGDNEAARLGEIKSARLRKAAPAQGGDFFVLASDEEVFVRSDTSRKLTEGAEALIEIVAEARRGKLARGRLAESDQASPQNAFERWIRQAGDKEPPVEFTADLASRDIVRQAFDEAVSPTIGLPGGGCLHIGRTRALTAFDIDTAGRPGRGSAGARALSINREAVTEVARHLALRSLGGLVVIDCVAPLNESAGDKLREAFLNAFKAFSPGQSVEALRPSRFGLLEATTAWGACPVEDRLLDEAGKPTPETELLGLFRAAEREALAKKSAFFRLTLSPTALKAYIPRRKQCDALLQSAFSGRVSIASGTGEKSVVRPE